MTGCSSDTTGIAPPASLGAYFALRLNQHAINLSVDTPSNTIQLQGTALDATGSPLSVKTQVAFRTTSSGITITPSGLITARYPTLAIPAQVIATLQYDQVTHVDTALVRVTQSHPIVGIKSFVVRQDSTIGELNASYYANMSAYDSSGVVMPFGVSDAESNLFYITSSNPSIASRNSAMNGFYLADTGDVIFYATSWMYGIAVQDSLKFFVGWPTSQVVAIYDATPADFSLNATKFLKTGGTVNFYFTTSDSVDLVFDDSTTVDSAMDFVFSRYSGSGNVHFGPGINFVQARSFPKAGRYRYHKRLNPAAIATIYVENNPVR